MKLQLQHDSLEGRFGSDGHRPLCGRPMLGNLFSFKKYYCVDQKTIIILSMERLRALPAELSCSVQTFILRKTAVTKRKKSRFSGRNISHTFLICVVSRLDHFGPSSRKPIIGHKIERRFGPCRQNNIAAYRQQTRNGRKRRDGEIRLVVYKV